MKAEESIEIDDLILRNRDTRTHGVVIFFSPGNDDVESINGSALKDDDEAAGRSGSGFSENGAHEEAGNGGGAGEGESALVKKESAIELHVCPQGLAPLKFW